MLFVFEIPISITESINPCLAGADIKSIQTVDGANRLGGMLGIFLKIKSKEPVISDMHFIDIHFKLVEFLRN